MSKSVIDSLVVELGLDPKNFTDGQKKAAEAQLDFQKGTQKTQKDLDGFEKTGKQAFDNVAKSALTLFAIIAGGRGIKDLIGDAISMSAAAGRMATNIGISTTALSAWENAVRDVGGSKSDADSAFSTLTQAIASAEAGQPNATAAILQQHGIKLTNANGTQRDPTAIMGDVANWFHELTPQMATFFGGQLGFNQSMISLLEKGAAGVAPLLQPSISPAESAMAQAIQLHWGELQTAIDTTGNDLMMAFGPSLISNMDDFAKGLWLITQVFEGKISWRQIGADFLNGINPPPVSTANTSSQSAVLAQGMAYFQSQGWAKAQAAAIMANAQVESSLNPGAVNPLSGAAGLFQLLDPTRVAQFKTMFHVDPQNASVSQQLEFAQWELTHTYKSVGDRLRKTNDAGAGAVMLGHRYENPYTPEWLPQAVRMDEGKRASDAYSIAGRPTMPTVNPHQVGTYLRANAGMSLAPPSLPSSVQSLIDGLRAQQSKPTIGSVNIYHPKDSREVVRDVRRQLSALVVQSNSGLV